MSPALDLGPPLSEVLRLRREFPLWKVYRTWDGAIRGTWRGPSVSVSLVAKDAATLEAWIRGFAWASAPGARLP